MVMGQQLKRTVLVIIGCLLSVTAAFVSGEARPLGDSDEPRFETRCGWFVNPTPANIWLLDRDAEWTIAVQGAYQLESEWGWPVFKPGQWVQTNGNYGYGCACMQIQVDKETRRVVAVKGSRARPLSVCRRDRTLRKWKRMLE
jgi:hypothetical protein